MISYFDKIPTEVLHNIIQYFTSSKKALCQFRLVSKQWSFIAETYIYNELDLSSFVTGNCLLSHLNIFLELKNQSVPSNSMLLFYGPFFKSYRCKLVKTLTVDARCLWALDDAFFDIFPNIEAVRITGLFFDGESPCFYKTFTKKRCRLKGQLSILKDKHINVREYIYLIHEHHQTLETLDGLGDKILQNIGASKLCLPNVKQLSADLNKANFQDLDAAIDQCPVLNALDVHLYSHNIRSSSIKLVPKKTHSRPMSIVTAESDQYTFFDLCSYFTTKFPDVQKWCLSDERNICRYDMVTPFEQLVDPLSLILKSKNVELSFLIYGASLMEASSFFCESYSIINLLTFNYESLKSFWYTSHKSAGKSPNIASMRMVYPSRCKEDASAIDIEADCSTTDLYHLGVVEQVGYSIRNIAIRLPMDDVTLREIVKRNKTIMEGGMLAHLIKHCPLLKTIKYEAHSLRVSPNNAITENKTLSHISVTCAEVIEDEQLLNLSHLVPNLTNLTITAPFYESESDKPQGTVFINMPQSSFDRLALNLPSDTYPTGCEYILIKIVLSGQSTTRYYIKKYSAYYQRRRASYQKHITRNQKAYVSSEQEHSIFSKFPHLEVTVACKSIKQLVFLCKDSKYPLLYLEVSR